MAKELYLYSPIYDFVAEGFIAEMEANKTQDVEIRANTPGGNVFAGWGMIAKIKEHEGNVKMKVDGYVASMGTILLAYVDDTEALDISRVHLHRADGYVNSPEDQAFLDGINKDLRAKLTAKIDSEKFKEVTGKSIDDLFNPKERIEVWLTARQAKQVGLIKKIVKLEPQEIAAMNRINIAASAAENPKPPMKEENPKPTKKVMNLEELKAQHPEIYAQVIAKGKEEGKTEETDRVRGWEAFRNIDAEAVTKGIQSGKAISTADIAEFTAKAISPEYLEKIKAASAKPVETGNPPAAEKQKTEDEKSLDALEASAKEIVKKNYGAEAGKNGVVIKSLTV